MWLRPTCLIKEERIMGEKEKKDDLDFNCGLELCYYCLDMMKEEEKEEK